MRTPVAISIFLCGSRRSSAITSPKTASTPAKPTATPCSTVHGARLERHRLEEEHRLEALPVDAREAERDEPDRLRREDADRRAREDALLALVQVGEVLLPVDPVVEPVEDQEQDGDRDERDHRLELLPPPRERAEHGLRDDPRDDARGERADDAEHERAAEPALRADHARHQRGEDEHGLEALAEDDDRAVRDHGGPRARARADPHLRLGQRLVEGETGLLELRERRLALDQLHEPVGVAVPVPEERLDLLERAGRDPAQPLLGPELEDAVRLEPRLLGPAPVALRGGRLDAVERRGDHVEVRGLGGLVPSLGEDRPGEAEGVLRRCPDRVGRLDPVAARGGGEVVAERRERRLELSGRGGVAAEEDRLEVGERGGRAVAERDRLLDLEVEHDAPVADAASVLDRDELGEAQELAGAPQLLRVGERRGAEALERALEPDERARRGAGVRLADEPRRRARRFARRAAGPRCAT